MDLDNGDDPFTEVDHDSLLQCNHDVMPVYIPPLKAVLTVGHYVVCSTISGKSLLLKFFTNMGDTFNCMSLPTFTFSRHLTIH
jgi:hypothetical protein